MGVSLAHRRPHVAGQRVAHAAPSPKAGRVAEGAFSWPASHLRNTGPPKRCGHQNRIWYAGAFFGRLHAGHLRPCNDRSQAGSGQNNGQHSLRCGIVLSAPHPVGVSVRVKKNQQASYWAKKCGKSPAFVRNQDFLAAERGLEPPTSGLWVQIWTFCIVLLCAAKCWYCLIFWDCCLLSFSKIVELLVMELNFCWTQKLLFDVITSFCFT